MKDLDGLKRDVVSAVETGKPQEKYNDTCVSMLLTS